MHSIARTFIAMVLLGGSIASGSVTVSLVNHFDQSSYVNLPIGGGSFQVDITVTATGEGTGITGVRLDFAGTGPSGGLLLTGQPAAPYQTPIWDNDVSGGYALPMVSGSVVPGPLGPHGTRVAGGGVLPNGATSVMSTVTLQAGTAPATFTLNVTGVAYPDYLDGRIQEIPITPGPR